MRTHYLTFGITLLMLTGFVGAATAKDQQIHWKISFSGSSVSSQSDTNKDGDKGSVINSGFKGTLGAGTFQGLGEFVFSGPGPCPNGNAGFILTLLPGTAPGVYRFNSTGDLLFTENSSATLCFDPITTIQFFSGAENITGGTGRFAGATGSNTFNGTATGLFDDGAGNGFGALSGETKGTIIIP